MTGESARPAATRGHGVADAVTLANAACGLLAVVVLTRASQPGDVRPGSLALAGALILAGTMFDALDGLAARVWGASPLGAHLDEMSDAVTFGVAPAVLLAVQGAAQGGAAASLYTGAAVVHLIAVMLRLARHAAGAGAGAGRQSFNGLPSSVGAVGVLAVVALDGRGPLALLVTLALAGLMLSTFACPHHYRPLGAAFVLGGWLAGLAAVTGLLPLEPVAAGGLVVIAAVPIVAAVGNHGTRSTRAVEAPGGGKP